MKLNNLQSLRGIAALMVCCFHFVDGLNIYDHNWGKLLFSKGSIGVPIFFVISGFIMVYTTKKINFNRSIKETILEFAKKRIIRILPLYYLLTLGWMVLGGSIIYYFSGDGWQRLWKSIFFYPSSNFPVLYLGWSLNFEMFFYLIFAISLVFKKYRYYFILFFFLAAITYGSVFQLQNDFFKMTTNPINLYFLIGIVFALFVDKINWSTPICKIFIAVGIGIFTLFFFSLLPVSFPYMEFVIVAGLVFSYLLLDYKIQFTPPKFLIFLGDISYSLYLSHPFVEVFFRHFRVEGYFNLLYFPIKIVTVIFISSLLYYVVEKRVTKMLTQQFIKK